MSQVADRSCEARQKLGHALGLLDESENRGVFVAVIIPVARAMGALHTIEYSRGRDLAAQGPIALRFVREALEALQANPLTGVIEEATAAIAGSLGLVHGLAQDAEAAARLLAKAGADPGAATSVALSSTHPSVTPPSNLRQPKINVSIAPSPRAAPMSGLDATLPIQGASSDSVQGRRYERTQASAKSDLRTQSSQQPPAAAPPHARASQPRGIGDTQVSVEVLHPGPGPTGTQASPRYSSSEDAAPHPQGLQSAGNFAPLHSSKKPPPPPGGVPVGAIPLVVSLGAYSQSNFYKGLSGNDVVDDGGLFVATYDLPATGSSLWLTVHMPGGYEFEALALVKWSRATGVGDAPPGFGCVFRSLSNDARQLVYRYARNREPLFHDDL